jgi:hypothetical protein
MIEISERDSLIGYISDEYKSVNGFRPRWNFSEWTIEELREEADHVEQMVIASINAEKLAEERKEAEAVRFMQEWQIDRETYDRWMKDHDQFHKIGEYWNL